jgi:hypothetical protein
MAKTRKNKRTPLTLSNSTSANVEYWFKKMLEDVGYMVMAKGKGMTLKIQAYKKSFENLIKTIEILREEYTDRDRKRDMTTLLRKATYVYGFVKRHL